MAIDHSLERDLIGRVQRLARPMTPEPAGFEPRVQPLEGIRAVLFDVYGTLFQSGAGDIGFMDGERAAGDGAALLETIGLVPRMPENARPLTELLKNAVREAHGERRREGIEYPEVDIARVWFSVLRRLLDDGLATGPLGPESAMKLAAEYECRVNPVYPMPRAEETVAALADRGLRLGIVSNAQYYTELLFPAFFGKTHAELGFDPDFCVWSYELLEAKPSVRLFERACNGLKRKEIIMPSETLYVGNDMLNDVWAASRAGCKTAWFAGDRRSARPREEDPRCRGLRPDAVITDLRQILDLLD